MAHFHRCQLLHLKCGRNANSALLSESTSWGLGGVGSRVKTSVSSRYLGSSITLKDLIWGTNSLLPGYKSASYTSNPCIHPPFLI